MRAAQRFTGCFLSPQRPVLSVTPSNPERMLRGVTHGACGLGALSWRVRGGAALRVGQGQGEATGIRRTRDENCSQAAGPIGGPARRAVLCSNGSFINQHSDPGHEAKLRCPAAAAWAAPGETAACPGLSASSWGALGALRPRPPAQAPPRPRLLAPKAPPLRLCSGASCPAGVGRGGLGWHRVRHLHGPEINPVLRSGLAALPGQFQRFNEPFAFRVFLALSSARCDPIASAT